MGKKKLFDTPENWKAKGKKQKKKRNENGKGTKEIWVT